METNDIIACETSKVRDEKDDHSVVIGPEPSFVKLFFGRVALNDGVVGGKVVSKRLRIHAIDNKIYENRLKLILFIEEMGLSAKYCKVSFNSKKKLYKY